MATLAPSAREPAEPGREEEPGVQLDAELSSLVAARPELAPGVELRGELVGSAFVERQWLAERDGQFLQLTELLYRIAELADGRRTVEQIAAAVSALVHWRVGPDQLRWLVATRLIPAGLIAPAAGSGRLDRRPAVPSPLALSLRLAVVGADRLGPVARTLRHFYRPPIVGALLLSALLLHAWLYLEHGLTLSLREASRTPGLLLILLGLTVLSTAFHELGHAAALYYGGGRPRAIGVGFYLGYPAFYTDVTDCYRLGRWARVRTDLGGIYFNLLFALGMFALYGATGWEFPLLMVVLIDLEIGHQLLPLVRLDGYWVLTDLTGIPDLFSHLGAGLRRALPGGSGCGPALPRLRPWAGAVLALYALVAIPWLLVGLWLLVRGVPHALATAWVALDAQAAAFGLARQQGDLLAAATAATQVVLLALLPVAGLALLLLNIGRAAVLALWRWGDRSRPRRALVALALAGVVALVGAFWIPEIPL
ncbi:MAG TPA: hypothetical protein VGL23_09300 [Chloroflexota bacterium]